MNLTITQSAAVVTMARLMYWLIRCLIQYTPVFFFFNIIKNTEVRNVCLDTGTKPVHGRVHPLHGANMQPSHPKLRHAATLLRRYSRSNCTRTVIVSVTWEPRVRWVETSAEHLQRNLPSFTILLTLPFQHSGTRLKTKSKFTATVQAFALAAIKLMGMAVREI